MEDPCKSNIDELDIQAAKTWIYPTNYPIRDYQYNIVHAALLKNTLVSLPTGLGKTFIAAVVMYNFYRWYPSGKIVFMAPTRPLVKQQVDACYDIMAIPKDVTAELTGTKISTSRLEIWNEKRVFFITPQVLQNDLDTIDDLAGKIKCVVFDEAHKAHGNHSYCEVIRKLIVKNKQFRVLALSATPGSNVGDVQEVISNLLISHLEFRVEESLDVQKYVFERSLETVVVPLSDKLFEVRNKYIKVLDVYTRTLINYKVFNGNCSTLTKGKIFMTMKEFQQKSSGSRNYGEIMRNLNICVTLYHAFELLTRHGLRNFLSFFDEHISKPLLKGNSQIIEIMEDIREFLGPSPNIEPLPDGNYPEIPMSVKFGHPKYYKLRDILVTHFSQSSNSSRVIVFFEYRESAIEAFALMLQARPLVRPRIFIGQGSGITQRIQINVVKAFRGGVCNTLLSTCIGEEGLDVGDVDLIVCFDISNKSPIRMVQRMGRTGRKKEGKIIVLVTEGKEQQTLKDCLIHKNNIAHFVLSSKELQKGMYENSPRMLPDHIEPTCEKIYITVKKSVNSIKDMFRTMSSNAEPEFSQDLKIEELSNRIPETEMHFSKGINGNVPMLSYSKNIEKQRVLQPIYKINHTIESKLLVQLLQIADSKRFNIPVTQIDVELTQKSLKQGDIRNMFKKEYQIVSQEIKEIESFSNELFAEISNYVTIQMSLPKKCKHCWFNFHLNNRIEEIVNVKTWIQPDLSIFNTISTEDLIRYRDSLNVKEVQLDPELNEDLELFENIKLNSIIEHVDILKQDDKNDFNIVESQEQKSFAFQPPNNLKNILEKYNTSTVADEQSLLMFFKLTSLEDLFESPRDLSPCLFSSEEIVEPQSPILCSFHRVRKIKRKLEQNSPVRPNLKRLKLCSTPKNDLNDFCNMSDFLSGDIEKSSKLSTVKEDCESEVKEIVGLDVPTFSSKTEKPLTKENCESNIKVLIENTDLDRFCDVSMFLPSQPDPKTKSKDELRTNRAIQKTNDSSTLFSSQFDSMAKNNRPNRRKPDIDLNAFCDLSDFLAVEPVSKQNDIKSVENRVTSSQLTKNNLELDDFCNMSNFLIEPSELSKIEHVKTNEIKNNVNSKTGIENHKNRTSRAVSSSEPPQFTKNEEINTSELNDLFNMSNFLTDSSEMSKIDNKINFTVVNKVSNLKPSSEIENRLKSSQLTQNRRNIDSNLDKSKSKEVKTIENRPISSQFTKISTNLNEEIDFDDSFNTSDAIEVKTNNQLNKKSTDVVEKEFSKVNEVTNNFDLNDFCNVSDFLPDSFEMPKFVRSSPVSQNSINKKPKELAKTKTNDNRLTSFKKIRPENVEDDFVINSKTPESRTKSISKELFQTPVGRGRAKLFINSTDAKIDGNSSNRIKQSQRINTFEIEDKTSQKRNESIAQAVVNDVDLNDFCDLSSFLSDSKESINKVNDRKEPDLDLSLGNESGFVIDSKQSQKSTTNKIQNRKESDFDLSCFYNESDFLIDSQESPKVANYKIKNRKESNTELSGESLKVANNKLENRTESNAESQKVAMAKGDNRKEPDFDLTVFCDVSGFLIDSPKVTSNNLKDRKESNLIGDLPKVATNKIKNRKESNLNLSGESLKVATNKEISKKESKSDSEKITTKKIKKSILQTKNTVCNVLEQPDSSKNRKESHATNFDFDFNDFCNVSDFLPDSTITKKANKLNKSHNTSDSSVLGLNVTPKRSSHNRTILISSDDEFESLSPLLNNQTKKWKKPKNVLALNSSTEENAILPQPKKIESQVTITQALNIINKPKRVLSTLLKVSPRGTNNLLNKSRVAISSDDEFEDNNRKVERLRSKRIGKKNQFIDDEAELSEDENVFVSDDDEDGVGNLDCYDRSFVADETHIPTTQMHLKYLESVRSPNKPNRFKIPFQPKNNVSFIFSQEVNRADDTYLDDSFVVCEEDENEATQLEMSELDILEQRLKEMRREKKKNKSKEQSKKRKRVIRIESSDDEDDGD